MDVRRLTRRIVEAGTSPWQFNLCGILRSHLARFRNSRRGSATQCAAPADLRSWKAIFSAWEQIAGENRGPISNKPTEVGICCPGMLAQITRAQQAIDRRRAAMFIGACSISVFVDKRSHAPIEMSIAMHLPEARRRSEGIWELMSIPLHRAFPNSTNGSASQAPSEDLYRDSPFQWSAADSGAIREIAATGRGPAIEGSDKRKCGNPGKPFELAVGASCRRHPWRIVRHQPRR